MSNYQTHSSYKLHNFIQCMFQELLLKASQDTRKASILRNFNGSIVSSFDVPARHDDPCTPLWHILGSFKTTASVAASDDYSFAFKSCFTQAFSACRPLSQAHDTFENVFFKLNLIFAFIIIRSNNCLVILNELKYDKIENLVLM